MSTAARRLTTVLIAAILPVLATGALQTRVDAQARSAAPQRIDAEYTAKIKEYLTDPRISTELVDHLPASDTVPTPLKFHGRIVGTPGELTYARVLRQRPADSRRRPEHDPDGYAPAALAVGA